MNILDFVNGLIGDGITAPSVFFDLLDFFTQMLTGIGIISTSTFILGLMHFILSLVNYIPILFIVIQASIMLLSVTNSRNEQGQLSGISMIHNFIAYEIELITSTARAIEYVLRVSYTIVNTILPI